MTPETFKGVNLILTAPKNWDDEKRGTCRDLPVKQENGIYTSCWVPTLKEQRAIFDGACIYVSIASGSTQPPISLTVKEKG